MRTDTIRTIIRSKKIFDLYNPLTASHRNTRLPVCERLSFSPKFPHSRNTTRLQNVSHRRIRSYAAVNVNVNKRVIFQKSAGENSLGERATNERPGRRRDYGREPAQVNRSEPRRDLIKRRRRDRRRRRRRERRRRRAIESRGARHVTRNFKRLSIPIYSRFDAPAQSAGSFLQARTTFGQLDGTNGILNCGRGVSLHAMLTARA